jgi:hypothetical protein
MEEQNNVNNIPPVDTTSPSNGGSASEGAGTSASPNAAPHNNPPPGAPRAAGTPDEGMDERLERLGGEPAPVITPEEFARLQKAGQVHIDARGRIRTERPRGVDPGVSLRKRRAWYRV